MMSTDQDEVQNRSSGSSEHSEEENSDFSPPNKCDGNGSNEHAKPILRGRRGKKRKQRRGGSGAPCRADQQSGEEDHSEEFSSSDHPECEKHCFSWDSEEEDIEVEDFDMLNSVMIRPTDVPKAPENSTQFIIDDHDHCGLYMSFETPNPYLANYLQQVDDNSEIIEPEGEDAAYVDINYEYESPHDFDNYAYYDREFEISYNNNRFDELLRMPHNDLISGLHNFQDTLKKLNDELVMEDPDPILARLQTDLLELQEKHSVLKEQNVKLRQCLQSAGIDYEIIMKESMNVIATSELSAQSEMQVLGEIPKETLPASELSTRGAINELEKTETKATDTELKESFPEETSFCSQSGEQGKKGHVDANKENACLEDLRKESRHARDVESCITVKEKVILRDSEYHESCEEMSLNSVPEEQGMNTVIV